MKTQATENLPMIEWDRGERFDDAGDGHVMMYQAAGEGPDNRRFIGTWNEIDGNEVEISDIEELLWVEPVIDPKTLPNDQQAVEFQVDIDSPVLRGTFCEDGQTSTFHHSDDKWVSAWKVLHWRAV